MPACVPVASPRLATYSRLPEIPRLTGCTPPESNVSIRSKSPFSPMPNEVTELLPWFTAKRKRPSAVATTSWSESSGPTTFGMFSCPVPPVAKVPICVKLPSVGSRPNASTAFSPGSGLFDST